MSEKVWFLLFINIITSWAAASSSNDMLTNSESLGLNQTLVSSAQIYEAGFFVPKGAGHDKIYFGIWYYNLSDARFVVWVANRDSPARDPSSVVLKFAGHSGGQVMIAQQDAVIWSSNNVSNGVVNPVLQLLDTGNLVIRGSDHADDYVWQSFDYPTDTLLPNQKLGWSESTGLERRLVPWSNIDDPASGNFSLTLITSTGVPELHLKQRTKTIYRVGWMTGHDRLSLFNTPDEIYVMFTLTDSSTRFRFVVDPSGELRRYIWLPNRQAWLLFWIYPEVQCDMYMECGTYGVCDASKAPFCECLQGFVPRDLASWNLRDMSSGCVRRTRLECGTTEGFRMLRNMKVPMSGAVKVDTSKGLEECREACQKDCNCTAYTSEQVIDGNNGIRGSGCVMWMGDLLDMGVVSGDGEGQDLYIRLAAADLGIGNSNDSKITTKEAKKGTNKVVIGIGVSVAAATTFLVAIATFVCKAKNKTGSTISTKDLLIHNGANDLDLPLYGFDEIVAATNNFTHENKLGEGGFGCVFKGVLKGGEEIAVKRLSKGSKQGAEEFKNEVNLIAKLQHKNLVRLLGYCVERDEKMLIYEYLPNQSLDFVLFNKERCSSLLDWQSRFDIICGIARGLLYLHHDSRLKIIHRDLKASNVLLDNQMNPKISDFGMARIFKGDETRPNNTKRVVGTYGYMSPEYVMDGVFSIKSDVFSFGVLMLEIVTGKKTRAFCTPQHALHLIGYAWKMWEEGRGAELLDPSMGDSYTLHEVLKCIQVGLLCVQAQAKDRPTMLTVALLLSSETTSLPQPKLPGFYLGWGPDSNLKQQDESFTINQVTNSTVDVR